MRCVEFVQFCKVLQSNQRIFVQVSLLCGVSKQNYVGCVTLVIQSQFRAIARLSWTSHYQTKDARTITRLASRTWHPETPPGRSGPGKPQSPTDSQTVHGGNSLVGAVLQEPIYPCRLFQYPRNILPRILKVWANKQLLFDGLHTF